MIDIKELRIGSYILYPKYWEDRPLQVTGISIVDRRNDHTGIYEEFIYLLNTDLEESDFNKFVDYKNGVIDPKEIEPIPLTEEWLVKLGFNAIDDHFIIIPESDYSSIVIEKNNNEFNILTIPASLKYVHQLQNLFYCLTGEELKVNI